MKIYTRTGDQGQTGVIGGRVGKDDIQVEAYGTVDELNSLVGLAISMVERPDDDDLKADLTRIQHELFDCGGDLAYLRNEEQKYKVNAAMVDQLEQWIDQYDAEAPEIKRFILPGGGLLSAQLHVCRTVCRRAERRVVALAGRQAINPEVRRYLNRLSDLFFTLARTVNARRGVGDVEYIRSAEVFRSGS